MKKTLAAVAVLGAFAGTAMAADVTLYGVIDTGLNWTQTKSTNTTAQDTTDKFSMATGQNSGARWGLRGTEDLGNGYKVGFNLESSFKSDDGTMEKRLFHREALLFVQSDFGELSMGRTGALDAGTGRYNLMGTGASALGTGWDTVCKSNKILLGTGDRMDNTITYKTPTFAGVTVYAQASLQKDSSKADANHVEGSSDADRYYALGATYMNYGLDLALGVDMFDYGHAWADVDDGYTVTLGGSYDFEVVKAYLGAQYFKDIQGTKKGFGLAESFTKKTIGIQAKGYGITTGVDVPAFGGTFKVGALYGEAENVDNSDLKLKNYGANVGYVYPFSKRTSLYTAAGYLKTKLDAAKDSKTDAYQVTLGLSHKF